MMERLTFEGNFCDIAMCDAEPNICGGTCSQRKVWERLKYYEDMEEQGRLAVLPCKVGDTLFFVRDGEIYSGVFRYAHWENHKDHGVRSEIRINITPYATMGASFDEIGKTVFLTREEAENALATDKNVGSKNGGAE